MKIGVYILRWPDCKYYYYGSSLDLDRRKRNHLNRMKRGVHENFIVQKVYNSHGTPDFEILLTCDKEDLEYYEQVLLDLAKRDRVNNLNLLFDPSGAGRVFSEESRRKISKSLTGKVFSETHLENLRRANSGENNPNFGNTLGKNPNAKKVINTETGEVYGSAKELVTKGIVQMKYDTFKSILNGRIKTNPTPYRNFPSVKQEVDNLIFNI